MRYTICLQGSGRRACIKSEAGIVDFNGEKLLPHEAAMLADALGECAEQAETNAATLASQLQPEAA